MLQKTQKVIFKMKQDTKCSKKNGRNKGKHLTPEVIHNALQKLDVLQDYILDIKHDRISDEEIQEHLYQCKECRQKYILKKEKIDMIKAGLKWFRKNEEWLKAFALSCLEKGLNPSEWLKIKIALKKAFPMVDINIDQLEQIFDNINHISDSNKKIHLTIDSFKSSVPMNLTEESSQPITLSVYQVLSKKKGHSN